MTVENVTDWLLMSGQTNASDRCSIFDVDYNKIERLRDQQLNDSEFCIFTEPIKAPLS